MRQRLGIANALLVRPEVMVLDEPVNGLDPEGMAEIRELILKFNQQEKVTIIISSHILTELSQMCSDYIFINSGTVVEEISQQNLFAKCKRHFCIRTNQNEKSAAIDKSSPWLGHDPNPCFEHMKNKIRVWSDDYNKKQLNKIYFIESDRNIMIEKLKLIENDLIKFSDGPLYKYFIKYDPTNADQVVQQFKKWFSLK